ncbi:hypothetical protein SAMN05192558_109314 [Actinokineospora alba]|uniref:Uncharacterized protein n=1 Tax=Actinokineospora alba TaxID=504798 RepID=A0A1H0T7N5_9PSEU|nr:hypothetical protein [Actinokineospora alba]TDP66325.1 hypothetical protein C8E96_1826 [Actinokineospora alba]SDJ22025.1 hypothetical protein SAMN05421871_11161 [Actinokineospora alba]SDP50063.1 hypothetical protein SAMN05192558_109314 [Actinokineospora alba]
MRITTNRMSSDHTRHHARTVLAGDPYGLWVVSWLPHLQVTRDQAITAVTLAEVVAQGVEPGDRLWPVIVSWASELGLTGPDAVNRIAVDWDGADEHLPPRHHRPEVGVGEPLTRDELAKAIDRGAFTKQKEPHPMLRGRFERQERQRKARAMADRLLSRHVIYARPKGHGSPNGGK